MPTTFAVPDGRVAMAATLYSGNNSTQTVSNIVNTVGMQPDLVWIKSRNISGANHVLTDSVRGVTKFVFSNLTAAEYTIADTLTSFNSNGFSLGNTAYDFNITGNNYVGWQWKAGGTAVSNTAGTITSSVSANTTAGFSVVTYTGTGATGTVGHGLGVAPSMIIIKSRSASATAWRVFASILNDNSKWLALNTTEAATTESGYWNTGVTSSVFGLGAYSYINGSGTTYVAYCWAPVAGYSAFGSYTGNGSADGPFIYTGFRPRFVMVKRTDGIGNWWMFDTSRSTYNVAVQYLIADTSAVEGSDNAIDVLSNGFKLRLATYQPNTSGATFIYAAYAENPLKYANAR